MRHVGHNNVIECRCVLISNTRFCQSYGSPVNSLRKQNKTRHGCDILVSYVEVS